MITTNYPKIENDLNDVIRSFIGLPENLEITHNITQNGINCNITVAFSEKEYNESIELNDGLNDIEHVRLIKRYSKILLYKALQETFPEYHPWGSLTGIRPVKLFRMLSEKEGVDAESYFKDVYLVSPEKTSLTKSIYDVQKPIYERGDKGVDLYIGIPFCLSRCDYCSFISQDLRHTPEELVDRYVESLMLDILFAKHIIFANNYKLRSVYMGGGTPTALTERQLAKVLSICDFDTPEFTIEAGRPDTITKGKLDLIAKVANRISVNPQTIHDKTLKAIGRNHTFSDFLDCYEMAKGYNFSINCDLIAGLSGEKAEDFISSVEKIISLDPDNITLHTLALKAGSKLKETTSKNVNDEIIAMIDGGYDRLFKREYKPYYLYRQKYMAGNLENTGFYKKSPCVYNVDIMEENTSIIACGANAISKRYFSNENRIERVAYPKDVKTYIEKMYDNSIKREKLFEND